MEAVCPSSQQRSWQQSEEVAFRRRGLTRGATQSLKRGIVSAQERLKPLRAAQGWLHAWILLEVFSGMSELTMQAAYAGWQSLQPIELMCGDDLFDPKQVKQFEEDVKAWEPDLLVMEPPCGPWCSWQNLADPERVEALRERHKPLWLAVRRAWDAQTRAGRLALTEQPQTSAALRLEEMQGRPQLHRHVTQQCAHGLKDPVSQLPYHKSTSLDTNDAEFNEFLEKFDKPCQCAEHETMQGTIRVSGRTVNRSAVASRWTPQFCRYILKAATAAMKQKAEKLMNLALHEEVPEEFQCLICSNSDALAGDAETRFEEELRKQY